MLRPGLQQFINFLLNGFRVAIWSSMLDRYLIPILKLVTRNILIDLEQHLEFFYDRGWCYEDHEIGHPYEPGHGLFTKPFAHIDIEYDRDNTILLDETPEKARYNPAGSFIKAPGFDGDENDDFFERSKPFLYHLYFFPGRAVDYVQSHHIV